MRAIQVTRLDGPGAVELVEVDEPAPGPGQVVIDVRAAGVAWPDLLQTRGLYQIKPPVPFVPGSELAGVVRSAPPGTGFGPGDRVAALTMAGAWQEVVAVSPERVVALPESVSFEAGAGLLLNYLTMHFAYRKRAHLEAGQTVLVHGAAGGVGDAAIRLGSLWGAHTIAVVSSPAKGDAARAAGADEVVTVEGFLAQVRERTGGRGVDLVVDPVGGDRFTDSLRALAREGSLLVLGFTGGEIPTVKVNRLLLGNTAVVGVAWGEYLAAHPGYLHEQLDELVPALADGRLRVPACTAFPLDDAGQVLTDMDERRLVGKVVLTP